MPWSSLARRRATAAWSIDDLLSEIFVNRINSRRKCILWKTLPRWLRVRHCGLHRAGRWGLQRFADAGMHLCARRPQWQAGPIWPCKEEHHEYAYRYQLPIPGCPEQWCALHSLHASVDNCRHRRHDPGWTGNSWHFGQAVLGGFGAPSPPPPGGEYYADYPIAAGYRFL